MKDSNDEEKMKGTNKGVWGSRRNILWVIFIALGAHYLFHNIAREYEYPGTKTSVSITGSNITFTRTEHLTLQAEGGDDVSDLYKALGWMHAKDRYVQLCLMRLAAQGKLTEVFPYDSINEAYDIVAKQMNFHKRNLDVQSSFEEGGLAIKVLKSYVDGINEYMRSNRRPLEFVLVNYHPEPFVVSDITTFIKFVTYIGLDEMGFAVEKFVIELARSGKVSLDFLKESFHPHLANMTVEHIQLFKEISELKSNNGLRSPLAPAIVNSNNWVVSGQKSASGLPIMSSDPHLDVAKTPNTFYESAYKSEKMSVFGISVPGIPIILMGRNAELSFSLTYGMMDMSDYFIERVVDGRYERDGQFLPLSERKELVAGRELLFYETAEGHIIERLNLEERIRDGIYLGLRVPTGSDEKTFEQALLPFTRTVEEAQELLPFSNLGSNYLLADVKGTIGYQQSGNVPLRGTGTGLLTLPAWDSKNLWKGYLSKKDYKRSVNPPEQFYATANNLIQEEGKPCVITYPAMPTRVNRISSILRDRSNLTVEDMKEFQGDTFSMIADQTIPLLEPYLPATGIGSELRSWDRRFQVDSRPAALWFLFWAELTRTVGAVLVGEENYELLHPPVFNKYSFYKFTVEAVERGTVDGRPLGPLLQGSLERSLGQYKEGMVYGELRSYFSKNMFFSGKLPAWFGLDVGPYPTNSGLEVLKVGSVDTYLGAPCVFTQTWRFVTDMSSTVLHSILPGGPSGNVFSNLYKREIENYVNEIYKVLQV